MGFGISRENTENRRSKMMRNFLAKRFDKGTQKCQTFMGGNNHSILYFYGRHYELARWTGKFDRQGREILILNKYRYSNTTATAIYEMSSVVEEALEDGVKLRVVESSYAHDHYLECIENRLFSRIEQLAGIATEFSSYNLGDLDSILDRVKELDKDHREVMKLLGFPAKAARKITQKKADEYPYKTKTVANFIKDAALSGGVEIFNKSIHKAPIKFVVAYLALGGTELPIRKVGNPRYNYFRLIRSQSAEEAIPYLNHRNYLLREAATSLLTKGAA